MALLVASRAAEFAKPWKSATRRHKTLLQVAQTFDEQATFVKAQAAESSILFRAFYDARKSHEYLPLYTRIHVQHNGEVVHV